MSDDVAYSDVNLNNVVTSGLLFGNCPQCCDPCDGRDWLIEFNYNILEDWDVYYSPAGHYLPSNSQFGPYPPSPPVSSYCSWMYGAYIDGYANSDLQTYIVHDLDTDKYYFRLMDYGSSLGGEIFFDESECSNGVYYKDITSYGFVVDGKWQFNIPTWNMYDSGLGCVEEAILGTFDCIITEI